MSVILAVGGLGLQQPVAAQADLEVPPAAAQRADIAERRTAYSQTWPAKGGGWVTQVSPEPVFWRDGKKRWRPYELSLKRTGHGSLRADVGDSDITLPSASSNELAATSGPHRMRMVLRGGARLVAPVATGREAVYPDIFPGVTRKLRTVAGGVKEDLLIASQRAQRRFEYSLRMSPDLAATLNSRGDVEVRAGTAVVFTIPRGVAYEQANPSEVRPTAKYELEREGDSLWRLVVQLDEKWASDPTRQWPVVLDPTINTYVDTDQESPSSTCKVKQTAAAGVRGLDVVSCSSPSALDAAQYKAGLFAQRFVDEALFQFALPGGGSSSGGVVTDARLTVHPTATSGAGPFTLRAARLTQRAPMGYMSNPHSVVPTDVREVAAGVPATFDVTALVQGWRESRYTNWGLALTTDPGRIDLPSAWTLPPPVFSREYRVTIAGPSHPDIAKRPVLTIRTATLAQAVSEITSPTEGALTSRFVELVAKAGSANVSSAKFEYRAANSASWQDIPVAALRFKASGDAPSSPQVPVPSGHQSNSILIWDLNKTPGAEVDGPVHVRAILDTDGGAGGGYTRPQNFRLDRRNPSTSSAVAAGPGNVDLLTGDLAISEADASVAAFLHDLSLTRTYHSRGVSPRNADMFGPGWIAGFEADGGETPYRGIYNFTKIEENDELVKWNVEKNDAYLDSYDAETGEYDISLLSPVPVYKTTTYERRYAAVELNDGSKITFRQEGGQWKPDDDHRDLRLDENVTAATFSIKGPGGDTVTFKGDAVGSPQYRPIAYAQAGSSLNTTYQYEPFNGRLRLKRIVAPTPSNLECKSESWASGCRALELDWGEVPVGSGMVQRVRGLRLRATAGADSHPLATYHYDSSGRLQTVTDPRAAGGLPTSYAYDGDGRMVSYSPPGERPWTFAYQPTPGDAGLGRLRSVTRKTPAGSDAKTTFVFDVPLAGSGAPHDLSHAAIATWAQGDAPRTATAVFPPDAVPAGSGVPTSWGRATVHYLGTHGKPVNVADAEGNIETTEYNDFGNVVRELTASNRERALAAPGSTAAQAKALDTQFTYAGNDVDLHRTLGPEQGFRRPDGSTVVGRQRTLMWYDAGKPSTEEFAGDQHRLTELSVGIRQSGPDGVILDEETTTHAYSDGANHRGWAVGGPLSTTVGSGSDAATTRYSYHSTFPLLVSKQLPKSTGYSSHALRYYYYGIGSSPDKCTLAAVLDPAANPAAAAGALCAVVPTGAGAPPVTPGIPRVATYTTRYSVLWEPIEVLDASPTDALGAPPLRRTKIGRDALGREIGRSVTSGAPPLVPAVGVAVPAISSTYSASTGRLTMTSDSDGRTVSRLWDDNGRLAEYTDALGVKSTYSYDINGRQTSIAEASLSTSYGTRGFVYDDRDEVKSIIDSKLPGPINAERDADGQVVSQTLPGGLEMKRTYDHSGAPLSQTWERTSGCAGSACRLAASSVERGAQGRIARHETGRSAREYGYDSLGRLRREDESRSGVCTRHAYDYDKNSNRTSRLEQTSAPSEACGTGVSSTATSTHDEADRITNAGYRYDALGRTLRVPASDSPDGATTNLTYGVDDLVVSIESSEGTQQVARDPMRRTWQVSTAGSSSSFGTMRYGSDSDSPVGKSGATWWERYVGDIDGGQVAVVTDTGALTWQLTDLQGNVVASIDAGASAPNGEQEYGAFGTNAWSSGTWTPSGHAEISQAWLGGYSTHTAGSPGTFVHMGARVYNPVSGRFLQVDPVTGGSANDYDYAHQDPVNNLDLTGQATVWDTHWSVPQARQIAVVLRQIASGASTARVPIPGIPGAVITILKELGTIGLQHLATEIDQEASQAHELNRTTRSRNQNRRSMYGVYFRIRMRLDGPRVDVKLADPMRKLVYYIPRSDYPS